MAIWFQNTLIKTSDFIRTSRIYSSNQHLHRAKKNNRQAVVSIGKMQFVHTTAQQVAELYAVSSWDNFQVLEPGQLPAALSPLSKISKKIKVGETVILSWAMLNRIDAYWIAGHFFAHLHAAEQIAQGEKLRLAAFTKPPKLRRSRRTHL